MTLAYFYVKYFVSLNRQAYHGCSIFSFLQTRDPDNGEEWESDPRWNNHKFQFVPKKPADYLTDKKYSRLGACSRTSR